MTRHPQRLPDYLGHIVQAIERIRRYIAALDPATNNVRYLSSPG